MLHAKNLAKRRVRTEIIRHPEVRVVEEIVELEANSQSSIFPSGNRRLFHDGKIGIEVTRCPETISSLGKGHCRTATWAGWARQVSGIEARFTAQLQESRIRIGCPVRQHLRWLARTRGKRNSGVFPARVYANYWPGKNGIDWPEKIV